MDPCIYYLIRGTKVEGVIDKSNQKTEEATNAKEKKTAARIAKREANMAAYYENVGHDYGELTPLPQTKRKHSLHGSGPKQKNVRSQ